MTMAIKGGASPRFVSDVAAAACGHWPDVLAGVGISFLPDGLVEDEPGLRTVAVSGPRMFRRIGLCYPAHQTLNPALRDLIPELASRGASW